MLDKNIENIFKTSENIEDLTNKLESEWFLVESWLVRKLLIERKNNKTTKYELFINKKITYIRKKRKIFNLIDKYSLFDTKKNTLSQN